MNSLLRSEAIRRLSSRYLVDRCHNAQREFVEDPSDRVLALCGRRSGKTDGIAARLVRAALKYPQNTAVYITLTRARANELCGSALAKIERNLGIGLHEYTRDGNLYWTAPNAGKIWLTGCSDKAEAEKFRGDARSEVAIDEADSMRPYLEYLALDCIEPSLLDLQGSLVLGGTPGPTLRGYFYEASTNPDFHWSNHHWTALENPHLPGAKDWIERKHEEMSRPRYSREILGIWERDLESLIFDYQTSRNAIDGTRLPIAEGNWRCVMGVDVGFNHPCAWAIWRYKVGYPDLYLVRTLKKSGLTPTQAGVETMKLKQIYQPSRLICDTGGIGKGYAEEWAQRYGLHIEPAQKRGRGERLSTFAGEVKSGQVKIDPKECRPLLDEWETLTWDDEGTDSADGLPDDCTDASMYAWSAIRPSSSAVGYNPIMDQTPEDVAREKAEADRTRHRKEAEKRARGQSRY